jgi:hypothetical protein
MERIKNFWDAFKDIAILFSFVVNFILVIVLLVVTIPALKMVFDLKTGLVEPLLSDLDSAFVGLGEASVNTTVQINEQIPIQFELPLSQTMPINFQLPLNQTTNVVLQQSVPLYGLPAQFNLPGGGGVINGYVSLSLPAGMALPVSLNMIVPVSQTIPVQMNVPVNQTVPIQMAVPVHITLGEAGLDPVVSELRGALQPVKLQIESLPDGF